MTETIKPQVPVALKDAAATFLRVLGRVLRWKPFWIVIGTYLLFSVVGSSCTTYVPPNRVGLKQVFYGSGAGIRPEKYGVGLHLVFGGTERLHLFPTDLQIINFSDSKSEVSAQFRSAPSIKVQTSDGYNVQLDVTVLYRLDDVYTVFIEAGPGRAFEDRLLVPRADRILRKTLGELNSEEFYQGPKRVDKAKAAHEQLAAELRPYGIGVDAVLIRQFTYDEKYQQLIEQRKIKDQTVFLRQAEAKAAIEQRKRDTIIAEGKANANTELSRGEAEVKKLQSQAALYQRKQAAEGTLLVELAEAKGTQLENTALQGTGSENMVGLKMAEVLKGVRVLVLSSDGPSGFNPLDLGSLMRKFEVP